MGRVPARSTAARPGRRTAGLSMRRVPWLRARYWGVRTRLTHAAEWIALGRTVAALGATRRARCHLRWLALFLPLRDAAVPRGRRRPITVSIQFESLRLEWRLRSG